MLNTITDESMARQYLKAKFLAERSILLVKLIQIDLEEIERITNGTVEIDIPLIDNAELVFLKTRLEIAIDTFEAERDGSEPSGVPGRSI